MVVSCSVVRKAAVETLVLFVAAEVRRCKPCQTCSRTTAGAANIQIRESGANPRDIAWLEVQAGIIQWLLDSGAVEEQAWESAANPLYVSAMEDLDAARG